MGGSATGQAGILGIRRGPMAAWTRIGRPTMPAIPWTIAASIASLFSLLDLVIGRNKALYWAAFIPVLARIVFDASAGLILLVPLSLADRHTPGDPRLWPAITAGVIAPLGMRVNVSFTIKGYHISFNMLGMLRRLQVKADKHIDEVCAVRESNWIDDKVMPWVICLPIEEIVAWSIHTLAALELHDKGAKDRDVAITRIRAAAEDKESTPDERIHLIVQFLQDNGGHRIVLGLMKRGKGRVRLGVCIPTQREPPGGEGAPGDGPAAGGGDGRSAGAGTAFGVRIRDTHGGHGRDRSGPPGYG